MPVRGVSVPPAMNRNFVTGAAPVWSRDIGRNDVMLMREPTITKKKKDLKKAELFVKSRLLQILFIIIHHPTDRHSLPSSTPPNPAPCQNIHTHYNAEQRRGQEGKSARRGDGPMPFS